MDVVDGPAGRGATSCHAVSVGGLIEPAGLPGPPLHISPLPHWAAADDHGWFGEWLPGLPMGWMLLVTIPPAVDVPCGNPEPNGKLEDPDEVLLGHAWASSTVTVQSAAPSVSTRR